MLIMAIRFKGNAAAPHGAAAFRSFLFRRILTNRAVKTKIYYY